jgi:hypothetical protein
MTKTAKELATRLRSDQARQNGISQREIEQCADMLDKVSGFVERLRGQGYHGQADRLAKILDGK